MKSTTTSALILVHLILFALSSRGAETLVEASPELKPSGLLATVKYRPTEQEEPYYKRLEGPQRVTVKEQDRDFTLSGQDGRFVSWFGIVRDITTDKAGMITGLLIENKYSHDMSDDHIQTVSINGAGDFKVKLETRSKDILPLILVRVYGGIAKGMGGIPVVQAEYLRIWHWFDFNFMDYGQDQSAPRWRKMRKKDVRVYSSRVSPEYYIDRLGPTDEQIEIIKRFDIEREKARKSAAIPTDKAMQAELIRDTIESLFDDPGDKLVMEIKGLLASGLDVNVRDSGGNTPLLMCADWIKRPAKVFKVLLDAGADVNARNEEGNTVLHMGFSMEDDLEALRLLINHGVSVTALNHAGESAFSGVAWLLDSAPEPGEEPDPRRTAAELLLAAGAGKCKDYMGGPVTVVAAVPQVVDPTVSKLADPTLRDEAFREILSWQIYRSKPSAPDRIFRPLRHVVVCPQKEGLPIYAVFPASRYEQRAAPKGHIMLIDADGAIIPYYCNANSIHDDFEFKDVNGDGVVDEVGTIGFGTSAGSAEVLHVLPVTRDQRPALNIVLKRLVLNKTEWSWKLAETSEPGVSTIELGPLDAETGKLIPKARYTWSKEDSRYVGPAGGGTLPFMRMNAATPSDSAEFDRFVGKQADH